MDHLANLTPPLVLLAWPQWVRLCRLQTWIAVPATRGRAVLRTDLPTQTSRLKLPPHAIVFSYLSLLLRNVEFSATCFSPYKQFIQPAFISQLSS